MLRRSNFHRSFSFPLNIISHAGVDFVLHDNRRYQTFHNKFFDAAWCRTIGCNTFLLWLVSKKDSHLLIRQLAASAVNYSQLITSSAYTLCDHCLSSIIENLYPNSVVFSRNESAKRGLIRMITVLRRNGGVFNDISDMILNFLDTTRMFPELKALNEIKFIEKNDEIIKTDYNDLKHAFRKEFGRDIEEVIRDIDPKPVEEGGFSIFNGKLKNGMNVSITFMNPKDERMRKIDLLPFKLLGCIFDIIPGLKLEKQIYHSFIRRLDYSIPTEVKSRLTIMEKYGIDINDDNPKTLFSKSRKIQLPIYLPAPIKSLCSEHIMISDIQPIKFEKLVPRDTKALVNFTSKLLFEKNCIISDLSKNNLRMFNDKLSLNKFSSLTQIRNENMSAALSLAYSYFFKNETKGVKTCSILGLPEDLTKKMISDQKINPKLIREVLSKNSELLLPLCEATSGILNSSIDSKAGKCAYAPLAAGMISKIRSPSNTNSTFPYSIGNLIQHIPY